MEETINARGHPNITANHQTTLMFTKESEIGLEADCIVAVAADKGSADLSENLKRAIASGAEMEIIIEVSGRVEKIQGRGHGGLSLLNPIDLVVRKSDYICDRTLAIDADKSASDLPREFVDFLKNPENAVKITVKAFD